MMDGSLLTARAEHGLILVFPDQDGSIFSPAVNRFVDGVEARVDASLVTFALTNGRHPNVRDALAAAAFAGCASAVIVVLDERLPLPTVGRSSATQVVRCRRDPAAVAMAFAEATGRAAACA